MEQYKFRGKSLTTGEWLVGSLYDDGGEEYIIPNIPGSAIDYELYQVDGNTTGMFSGLKDIHENEIFKGDIVRSISNWGDFGKVGEVVFDKGKFLLDTHDDFFGGKYRYKEFVDKYEWKDMGAHMEVEYTYEIIGNIYDNPELLKRK